ncbi:hypothetical protein TELCIR_15386 [Teladorsagia circumcincta]|uniref:Uncharacterized protein n=1 Tax=Teladorsagia circumcincta TaxID=45464 RepID=A0A2G9TYD8_TELCI|nr:hypothetical protein TELCIR_15386 [Teladorsagia circumcincta]
MCFFKSAEGALQVFDFVSTRLGGKDYQELFNALQWLHLLSRLEISIPLDMLLEKFSLALSGLTTMEIPRLGQNDLEDDDVSIHIVIIDILVLQLRLNEIAVHEQSAMTEKLFSCVSLLLSVPLRTTPHECKNPELDGFADCSACQQAAFLHQMIMNMTENVSPKQEMAITATEVSSSQLWLIYLFHCEGSSFQDEPVDSFDATSPGTSHASAALSPQTAPGSKGATTSAPSGFSEGGLCFQTATVEQTGDDEFVGILPSEEVLQTALSALFYHFVTSLHDPNPTVAQRAIIALRALPTQTLKLMCFCFESQFDSCITDRPLIINTIRLLTTQLPDENMLTFDFFIQVTV